MTDIKFIEGGVCAAKGFQAAGVHAGIRKNRTKDDVALIYSDKVCSAAAVYTKNKVKAAHIAVCKKHLAEEATAQAILCNSGNANACTPNGEEVAEETCRLVAKDLGIKASDVLPASTGVIGMPMDIEPFVTGIPALCSDLSYVGSSRAANAIMTTDTLPKEFAVSFTAGGKECRMGGIAKGSGMIHVNMGTMLAFMTTDCAISQDMIKKALVEEVPESFNQISIDGDTSTNDTLILMANGMAGNAEITGEGEDYDVFCEALHVLCVKFARMIAGDGEGATKLIEAHVVNVNDKDTARAIAKQIISSSLLKAAVFGSDANWGRILCAIGYTDREFPVDNVDISMSSEGGRIEVCRESKAVPFSEELALEILGKEEVVIDVDMHCGTEEAFAWGCDLTYDYVKINGDYRT